VRSRLRGAGAQPLPRLRERPVGLRAWKPSEIPSWTRSVSAFLLSRASTGPRSSGDVRSDPQPRAEVEGQPTTPSLYSVFP